MAELCHGTECGPPVVKLPWRVLKVKVRIELRHSQNPLCTGERELEVAVMGAVHDVSVKTGLVILTESITLVPC